MRRPATTVLIAGALALAAAGCGRSEPEQVEQTMRDFADAIAQRDYGQLCGEILSGELVDSARAVGLDCPVALRLGLEEVQAPRLEVLDVDIEGDQALARVRTSAQGQEPSEDAVRLVKQDGRWRVASLSAAQPQPPPPPPEAEGEGEGEDGARPRADEP